MMAAQVLLRPLEYYLFLGAATERSVSSKRQKALFVGISEFLTSSKQHNTVFRLRTQHPTMANASLDTGMLKGYCNVHSTVVLAL